MKTKLNLAALIFVLANLSSCQVCDEVMSLDMSDAKRNKRIFEKHSLPASQLAMKVLTDLNEAGIQRKTH